MLLSNWRRGDGSDSGAWSKVTAKVRRTWQVFRDLELLGLLGFLRFLGFLGISKPGRQLGRGLEISALIRPLELTGISGWPLQMGWRVGEEEGGVPGGRS